MARRISVVAVLLTAMALMLTLVAAGSVSATKKDKKGGEGCTPGYWKQSQHFDSWSGVSQSQDFDAALGVNLFNPNRTLLVALSTGGGGIDALGRHAAAAYLNSISAGVDYGFTTAQVTATVQAAITSGDYEGAKNILAALNEAGCPLN